MKRHIRPYKLVVNIPVEVDINELVEGCQLNTTISEITKNVGMYLREKMKSYTMVPGEEISIPDAGELAGNLHEFDLISEKNDEEETF